MTTEQIIPTRTCTACRLPLPFAAFRKGSKTCEVCEDPAPAHESGNQWEEYARSGDLADFMAAEDARLNEDIAAKMRRVDVLDGPAKRAIVGALGRDPSPAWTIFLSGLAISCWDTARRLSGMPELQVAMIRERGDAAFNCVADALRFVTYDDRQIGQGSGGGGGTADDKDPRVKANEHRLMLERMVHQKRASMGVQSMPAKGTRPSSEGARGEHVSILRVDVTKAIAASGIGAVDFALLCAADVGAWQPRSGAEKRRITQAFMARSPVVSARPPDQAGAAKRERDGTVAALKALVKRREGMGDLAWDASPAEQKAFTEADRAVEIAEERVRLTSGEVEPSGHQAPPRGRPTVEQASRWAATKGAGSPSNEAPGAGVELVRLKAGELAEMLNREIETRRERLGMDGPYQRHTATTVGKRLGRARGALARAMRARGLLPPEEVKGAKKVTEVLAW